MISHVLVARHPPQMSINDTTQVMAGYKLHEESASPVGNRLAGSFYFFYYAAMAALSPFLVLHYEQLGLDGRQIGLLAGIPPALILLGATGWGALADASQQHRAVLAVAIAGTIVAVAALSVAQTFSWLIAIVIFMALMQSPITPLVDNSVLHALGEHRDRYGRIRIWGAIGWGACGPIAGHLVERFGLSASFSTYLALFAICFFIALFLPIAHVRVPAFWSGLRALVGDRRWRLFLFLAFASGVGLSVVHHYLFLYLKGIGTPRWMMGYALTIGTLSEMLVFFYGERLLRRFGRRRLLVLSMAAGVVRVAAYSFIDTPVMALSVQILHGPTFALLWVVGVSYAHVLAPPGLGATAQGQFVGVNFGLGGAVGAIVGGSVFEHFGLAVMYRGAAIWLIVGLVTYLLAYRLMISPSKLSEPTM